MENVRSTELRDFLICVMNRLPYDQGEYQNLSEEIAAAIVVCYGGGHQVKAFLRVPDLSAKIFLSLCELAGANVPVALGTAIAKNPPFILGIVRRLRDAHQKVMGMIPIEAQDETPNVA